MQKYKLIKEYPGSPNLGTINGFTNGVTLGLHLVENQPEFWEKVVEEVKIPLFKTEDGVDMFRGDFFYNVNIVFHLNYYQVTNRKYDLNFLKDNSKSFSTKEKAEEYIFMNKKVLSIDDILEVWSALSLNSKESLMEKSTLMSRIVGFIKLK